MTKPRKPFVLQLALKKRFKEMTFCNKCKHLDGFQSCAPCKGELDKHGLVKIVSVCCGCGSTDIKRRPTIVLAQVFWSIHWTETKSPGVPWPEGVRRMLLREELERIWDSECTNSETEVQSAQGVRT